LKHLSRSDELNELLERASKEMDSKRLSELVQRILEMLNEMQKPEKRDDPTPG